MGKLAGLYNRFIRERNEVGREVGVRGPKERH
jgi:hypothetical protein